MRRLNLFFISILAVFFLTVPSAFAADAAATQSSWQYQAAMLIISTLGVVITTAVPLVARALMKKYHLEHAELIESALQKVVVKAVGYTEEQAAKKLAGSDITQIGSGNAKLEMAAGFALDLIKAQNLPQKSADEVKKLIEAHLGMSGTGATAPADPKPGA